MVKCAVCQNLSQYIKEIKYMQTYIEGLEVMWLLELNMPLKWIKLTCGCTLVFNVTSKSVKYPEVIT